MKDLDFKYLRLLEFQKVRPSFWCSDEYFRKAEFKEIDDNGVIYIQDKEGSLMFPPLDSMLNYQHPIFQTPSWTSFAKMNGLLKDAIFFDYEYIYDPKAFLNMTGKKWQVFRKNCRKYPARYQGQELKYIKVENHNDEMKVSELIDQWMRDINWNEIHDGEVMIQYLFHGQNREILIDEQGDAHGLNVWDENYMFINYRFCISLNLPFLSEYMRYLFYIHQAKQNKLVNDGGVLDNPNLKRFKDKLNPIEVNKIYSWRK